MAKHENFYKYRTSYYSTTTLNYSLKATATVLYDVQSSPILEVFLAPIMNAHGSLAPSPQRLTAPQ